MENSVKTQKKVLFHTGRGGRFNNPGYTTCKGLIDYFDAEYYGINTYYGFENQELETILYDQGIDISELANNFDEEAKAKINALKLVKSEVFGETQFWTADDLGDAVVIDDSGDEVCTIEEYTSEKGTFNIDHDYNTYYWVPISDLDEDELKMMVNALADWEYKDELIANGVDEDVFTLLEKANKLPDHVYDLYNQTTFDQFINQNNILVFDNEEDGEDLDLIELNDKFYAFED